MDNRDLSLRIAHLLTEYTESSGRVVSEIRVRPKHALEPIKDSAYHAWVMDEPVSENTNHYADLRPSE